MPDEPEQAAQRRVFRRTYLSPPIEIEPVPTDDLSKSRVSTTRGNVLDISSGGILAAVERNIPKGTLCVIRFLDLTGEAEPEEVRGLVSRSGKGPGGTLLGITFETRLDVIRVPKGRLFMEAEVELARNSVLIVDDEADIRWLLGRFFSARGCRVQTVADGEEALEAIVRNKPDLVMLDVRMPKLDGLGLLRRIREEGLDVGPIWAFSGYAGNSEAGEALRLGATDFINKPFDLQYLELSIRLHLAAP